jgi:hypothetical protein
MSKRIEEEKTTNNTENEYRGIRQEKYTIFSRHQLQSAGCCHMEDRQC